MAEEYEDNEDWQNAIDAHNEAAGMWFLFFFPFPLCKIMNFKKKEFIYSSIRTSSHGTT
jgi:hypothetical protein